MTNANKARLGEKVVKLYLEREGYKVIPSPKNGSDLVANRGKSRFSVEVKASENLRGGIPDMHSTEFRRRNGRWYLVADYLYVVRIDCSGRPLGIDILSKAEVDSYNHTHKVVTRIRTTKLDTDLRNRKVGKSVQISLSARLLGRKP